MKLKKKSDQSIMRTKHLWLDVGLSAGEWTVPHHDAAGAGRTMGMRDGASKVRKDGEFTNQQ